jgi:hypothetical protein
MKKPLQCLLGLHRWRTEHNEEGQRYELCLRCGTTRDKIVLGDYPSS